MATRIIRLPGSDPEALRDRLAEALANEDDAALSELLGDARRQLQEAIEGELHRLVGEIVLEVSAQPHLPETAGELEANVPAAELELDSTQLEALEEIGR